MGTLYIVPAPVGNMEDMTLRAIRTLKEADLVLAEDTRTSGILFKHFDIKNHLMSHHKFNEHGTSAAVVERLKAGQNVALVSDAGTPGISDPGFYLAREAAKAVPSVSQATKEQLTELVRVLGISEIHVIDSKGVIVDFVVIGI